jgi:hypothetical protein
MKIDLESEPYGPSGNIAAEGVLSLLGRPSTDQLNTCIRESVQNAWDARTGSSNARCAIRVRRLEGSALNTLRNQMFQNLPGEPDCPLLEMEQSESIVVLEISDFGTSGLAGPTNPSKVTDTTRATDFVDFFRNLGSPRVSAQGGGTYGYGKSSLYAISQYQTIIADTRAQSESGSEHRIMACRIGKNFCAGNGRKRRRFTGRHWWGRMDRGGNVQPVTGRAADRLSEALGFPSRLRLLGTTIAILEPMLPDVPPDVLALMMRDAIIWNFWPKLVRHDDGALPLEFSLEVFGQKIPIPEPEEFPPLHLYADALRDVRRKDDSCSVIVSQRPPRTLGHLQIVKYPRLDRQDKLGGDNQIIPDLSHHVALMRPAELVVRYLEGNPLPDLNQEWAGVFMCSDEDEVERAFADSEPPAHDDWLPSYLPSRSRSRTFVSVALKRIKEEMKHYGSPVNANRVDPDMPMARIADSLGALLARAQGDRVGPGSETRNQSRPRSTKRRKLHVSVPQIRKLRHEDGELVGEFEVRVEVVGDQAVLLVADAGVVLEGNSIGETAPNGRSPEILRWKSGTETLSEHDQTLLLQSPGEHDLRIDVRFPDIVALRLVVRAEEVDVSS